MRSRERGAGYVFSLVLVLLCSVILSSSSAFTASPVFGPETYTRTTGEPITETDTFTVSDPGAPHWLTITNGDQGEHQVTSGWVWINGTLEVHPSDFNPHVGRIKKRISLTATTTISVRLTGAPDSFLSLEIGRATGCLPMQFAGPWTFTRQAGPPRTETRNFSIEYPNNHYLLRIVNGDQNGAHRIASGWVSVNNVQIAQPSDFNQQVEVIEREVTLQQQNELKVKLASTPGAFITVSVLGDNIGAPTVHILVPQDGEINRTGTVDVSGTVSADAVTVLVNGVSAVIQDAATFFATGIPLPVSGDNFITATAFDACGRSATDTISVSYVPLPALAVQVTSPQEGTTFATSLANVSGTVSDDTAVVTVNGIAAAVAGGQFTATDVPLTPGVNTLTVTAVRGGETATDSVSVKLLTLSITSPTPGQEFTDQPITVTGEVSLPDAGVFVNGATGTVTGSTFTATNVPLLTGTQELIAYATHNGTTAQSPPITVRLSALGVTITSPMAGQTFAADTITVTGTVTRSTASVTVNGVSAAVNPTEHTFTAENVPLTPGATTLTAQATAGTETVTGPAVSVNLLKVTIISPTPGQEFTDQPITVSGEVSLGDATVIVNGIAAVVTGTAFTATNVPLNTGGNELIAYATHNGTTAQSPSVPVTLAPVTVAITSPTEGQEFTDQPITVSGTVSRGAATVTVNGVSATVNAAAHTFIAENVPLTPAENVLTAQATLGTETISHSVNVTLSNLTVSITSPADNDELPGEPVTVRGFVNLEGAQVTVNGIAATVTGTEFVADAVPLTSNPCVLKAVAVKGTLTAEAQVTVRIAPLAITIDSPAEGTIFTAQPITVSGTVSRNTATVTVNGVTAVVAQGRFAAEPVPLTPGANTIQALAQDRGETATASVGVSLAGVDVQALQATITSLDEDPQDLQVAGTLSVTVVNNGTGNVASSYRVLVFEDRNHSGFYEAQEDSFLGETTVDSGPPAGGSFDQQISFSGEVLFRGSPLQVLVDSSNDLDETDEANNLISTAVSGIDLTASFLRVDDAGCPGPVTLTARIGNRGDLEIGPGVSVTFYLGDPAQNGTLIGTALTTEVLACGHYEEVNLAWSDPGEGIKSVFVQADDEGQGSGTLNEVDETNNQVSADLSVCTGPPAQGPNSISGTVVNAVTGASMSSVTVSLHVDNGGMPGTLVNQYTTAQYGWFVFSGLTPGSYFLTAAPTGFVAGTRSVVFASGAILTHQDVVLSPVLSGDDIRIVLTWGADPQDLEAHLTAPNPEGCRLHLYYWERSIAGATLDTDAREGYGPETVTISERSAGTYRFYVHDFSNRLLIPSPGLSQSQAEVKVYVGDQPQPQVFTVPAGNGTVWHVFDLDGTTGQIVPVNRMTHQTDPVKIDFPRMISQPVTSVSAGETYRYQVEAEDPDLDTLEYVLQTHPEGMTIDADTGLIEWTPGMEQGGSHQVVLRAEDGRCGSATQEFRVSACFRPLASFTVEPCSGSNPGGTITFTWSTQRAETCVIDQGIGAVPLGGTLTIPSPAAPFVYTLTASNPAGDASQSVPRKPEVLSFPTGTSRILFGQSVTLSWSTSCAAYCRLNGEEVEPNGSMSITPEDDKSYSLTAVNAGGVDFGGTASILVDHLRATPTCGWHAGEEVTLTWGVPSWVTHCEITPGIGVVASTGTRVVTQTAATTYALRAEGSDGRSFAEEVEVPPAPGISYFNASRNTVEVGEEITLGWLTSCADTVTIDQGIGAVGAHGSLTLTPSQLPIMYTLTAANEKGSVSKTVLIEQKSPPPPPVPSVTFSAAPSMLKHVGETAVLTWNTENATSCMLDQGIGAVGLNGSISVTPDQSTTYRLTAVGPGGEITRTVTVTFLLPTASITADEFLIASGESTTLRWVVGNADSAVVTPGIGAVSPEGTATVTPGTTTYVITATGPGGRATASVTVRVLNLVIYSPSDNETVLEQPIRVIGHVTEPLAAVTVNSISAVVSSSGAFEVPDIPLALGPNVITASAQRNGKSVTKSITVIYQPLSIAISSPLDSAMVHAPLITVLGTVSSPGAQVTVNGISAWVDVNGTFRAEGISLIEGENTIVATAQHYELTATVQITITLSIVQTCLVPGEYATIQAALNASQPNQTIVVCPGTYRETLSFPGHSITLVGRDGPEATIIEGNLSQPVVSMWGQGNNHTLRGFTVINGRTGIFCVGAGAVIIEECVITGNITTSNGGGIYSDGYMGSPSLILRRCTISENQAASGAGVYLTSWVSATFDRCTIARNHATSEGGGIFHNNASCTLTNSLIWGNRAEFIGGAMNLTGGQCAITNCTISRNTSDYWCNGAFISYSCAPVVTNTILWDESGIENPSALTYSDTLNGYAGAGNISADPLFVDPDNRNFHLRAGSPCIDTGTADNAPARDIDGQGRPFGNGVDIGADEVSSGLTVEITAPANNALIEASPITVSGSISDPAATVTVNGVNATVSGLGFTATGIALTAGENTLTAVATKGSDTTAHRIIINYQPAVLPLAVEITSPQDGTIVTTPTITVAGTVSDDTAAVTVNGVSATITNGTFTASGIVLTEGSNTITATASRGADTVTDSIIITYQAPVTPLAVEITSPQDGATVTTSTITVAGTVNDNTATVTANGVTATVADGTFTASGIPLAEGPNTLTATATRGVETVTDTITVTYQSPVMPIAVNIESPANGVTTYDAAITVSGTVGQEGSTVTVNGVTATVENGHFTAANVPLTEGANTITATATYQGRTGTDSITVTRLIVGATLHGTIMDGVTGQSATGAVISITDAEKTLSDVAGADGFYEIRGILPGQVDLLITYNNYPPRREHQLTIPSDQVYTRNFTLYNTVTLIGTVTDGVTNQPAVGATVTVIDSEKSQSATTDAGGSYRIEGIKPGPTTVRVTYLAYPPYKGQCTLTDQMHLLNMTLLDTVSLTGKVTDARTAAGLGGATVTVTDRDKSQSAVTLGDGSYTITGIAPGDVSIVASYTGYLSQTRDSTFTDNQAYVIDFALYSAGATATVGGTVTNAKTLLPEPGVSITLEGTTTSAVSAADGSFTLPNVPMGPQRFAVVKEGFVDQTTSVEVNRDPFPLALVYPIVTGVTHPLRINDTVRGFVYDAMSGAPLAGASIKVNGTTIETTSGPDGGYTLTNLPHGPINLVAMVVDHEAVAMYPIVEGGANDRFDFNLPPTTKGLVTGTVTDAQTGQPIFDATVSAGKASLLAAGTEYNGVYKLVGVPQGTQTISITHPEYLTAKIENANVADLTSTTVNAALTPRPRTGALEGTVTDKDSGSPIPGATITEGQTGRFAVSDGNGYYRLDAIPAGLVGLHIDAAGYPASERTVPVIADRDYDNPVALPMNIVLDVSNPEGASSVTKTIVASEGGIVGLPDGRLYVSFPPGSLSADAVVTLRPSSDAPSVVPGQELGLNPSLGTSGIKAVGPVTDVCIDPLNPGDPIPEVRGGALVSGQYDQTVIDSNNLSERTIFPYYWDGSSWNVMNPKPYEVMTDPVNNCFMAILSFSTSLDGSPVLPSMVQANPSSKKNEGAFTSTTRNQPGHHPVVPGAHPHPPAPPEPPPETIRIYDKDELTFVPTDPTDPRRPNANALPLITIHGWEPSSVFFEDELDDPNINDYRYNKIMRAIIDNFNGVYRPVFVSHNSRRGIDRNGAAIAERLHGEYLNQPGRIKGKPIPGQEDTTGKFPYVDTFGFSMGGLVSRCYNVSSGGNVHNMITVGTPNHGTFNCVNWLRNFGFLPWPFYYVNPLAIGIDWTLYGAEGTADMLDYNDRDLEAEQSTNPTLYMLNLHPYGVPKRDLTLIAGNHSLPDWGMFLPGEDDSVVPVGSVFCRTSDQHDAQNASLFDSMLTGGAHEKYEDTLPFTHYNFGKDAYPANTEVVMSQITRGLSDWAVEKIYEDEATSYPDNDWDAPGVSSAGFARSAVEVQYNTNNRDIERVVLVIYARDAREGWFIPEGPDNGASSVGVARETGDMVEEIAGNSLENDPPLRLRANVIFPATEDDPTRTITAVVPCVVHLKPGETHVPLDPMTANFSIPEN